jgi:hypothetical protein
MELRMILQKIVSVFQNEERGRNAIQDLLDAGWHVAHATPLHGHGYASGEVQYILSKYEDDPLASMPQGVEKAK